MDYISQITINNQLQIPEFVIDSKDDIINLMNSNASLEVMALTLSHALSIRANMKKTPVSGDSHGSAFFIKKRVMDTIYAYSLTLFRRYIGEEKFQKLIQTGNDENIIIECADEIDEFLEHAYFNNIKHEINLNNLGFALLRKIDEKIEDF